MPQNEHIELYQKRHGKRLDHEERTRKKKALRRTRAPDSQAQSWFKGKIN